MATFDLAFKSTEALQYQKAMMIELRDEHRRVLQKLQKMSEERKQMRSLVDESPEVWDAMVQIIKPTSQITDAQKKISLQEKLVQFLSLKIDALDYMIIDWRDPKVIQIINCYNSPYLYGSVLGTITLQRNASHQRNLGYVSSQGQRNIG